MTKLITPQLPGGTGHNAPDVHDRLGRTVRFYRQRLHLTQNAFARRAGMHRTYLVEIEMGRRNIALANLSRLAGACGVKLSRFFATLEALAPSRLPVTRRDD